MWETYVKAQSRSHNPQTRRVAKNWDRSRKEVETDLVASFHDDRYGSYWKKGRLPGESVVERNGESLPHCKFSRS
jgi:hypothetical protein